MTDRTLLRRAIAILDVLCYEPDNFGWLDVETFLTEASAALERDPAMTFPTPTNILEYGPKTSSLSLTFKNEADRTKAVAIIRELVELDPE